MARMVGYQCEQCGHEDEELFGDTENRPVELDRPCEKCGGKLVKCDLKNNCHRWNHNDRGGL
jgi:predicted nucleic acid-binding Zn ribbon protein